MGGHVAVAHRRQLTHVHAPVGQARQAAVGAKWKCRIDCTVVSADRETRLRQNGMPEGLICAVRTELEEDHSIRFQDLVVLMFM